MSALWWMRVGDPVPQRVLPDGCLDLILRRGASGSSLIVAGPATRAQQPMPEPGERLIGLRFAPGWGGALLGLDPAALREAVLPAEDLSPALRDLAGNLASLSLADVARRLLAETETWAAIRQPSPLVREAVRAIARSGGTVGTAALAATLGSTPRTLRRAVGEAVGLPPKTLARVLRFQRALRLHAAGTLDLAALAAAARYADQAHMTREFRALGGFTPGTR